MAMGIMPGGRRGRPMPTAMGERGRLRRFLALRASSVKQSASPIGGLLDLRGRCSSGGGGRRVSYREHMSTLLGPDLWRVTGVGHDGAAPTLELRSETSGEKDLLSLRGAIDLRVGGPRGCVGYRAPGSPHLVACDQAVRPATGSQCERCAARAKMVACLRCTGLRCANPARRDSCVQPDNHAVYLASFGPGAIKVGVARWERRRARLIEQGALAALIVARDDGQQVRRLEATILGFGLADRSRGHDRLSSLWSADDPAALRSELAQVAGQLRRRLLSAPWLPEAEAVSLPAVAQVGGPVPALRIHAPMPLSGPIITSAGHLLAFLRDGAPQAVDLSALIGYTVQGPQAQTADPSSYQMALPLS